VVQVNDLHENQLALIKYPDTTKCLFFSSSMLPLWYSLMFIYFRQSYLQVQYSIGVLKRSTSSWEQKYPSSRMESNILNHRIIAQCH